MAVLGVMSHTIKIELNKADAKNIISSQMYIHSLSSMDDNAVP